MNFDWEMMTYWAIAGLSHAVLYYRESRDRALRASQLETKLVEARMAALQHQLQPHFLFNTLHAISALMHRDVDAADRTLMRLSDLLRMTLENLGHHESTLKAELDFLAKYLEIEQTRFADRLVVRFDVEPDALDARLPTLLLQPLVENAIKHGVSKKAGPGPHRYPGAAGTRQAVDRSPRRRPRPVGDRADGASERHRRLDDAGASAAPVRRRLPVRVPPSRSRASPWSWPCRGGPTRRSRIARSEHDAPVDARNNGRGTDPLGGAMGTARSQTPALRRPYLGHTI